MSQPNQNNHNFKDTKIFVGGLAWRTTTDDLRRYFEQYGEVIDANVVSEGLPGGNIRSKGYGFVVFRDAESANRACEQPEQDVDGRRANVNMAYMRAKNKTNQSNQNGLLEHGGPSHQYQNGLFNQAASHQFQPSYQYPNPYFPQPYGAPYYGLHPYMYHVPCYSYSTAMVSTQMHQYVSEYRRQRNLQRLSNEPIVTISKPPNQDTETDNDQEGKISREDSDIKKDVNDQELETMSGVQEDDTKQDVDVTKQLDNGTQVTLQREIVHEEEAENTPEEEEEEEGEEQDRVREAISLISSARSYLEL